MFLKFELPEGTILIDPTQIAAIMDRTDDKASPTGAAPEACTILFKGTQQNIGLPMSAARFEERMCAAQRSIKVIDA